MTHEADRRMPTVIPHEDIFGDSAWIFKVGNPNSNGFIPLEVPEAGIIEGLTRRGYSVTQADDPNMRRLIVKRDEEIITSLLDLPGIGICVVDIHDQRFADCFNNK